jgi:uncharacterized LabA/DUF88 family protein
MDPISGDNSAQEAPLSLPLDTLEIGGQESLQPSNLSDLPDLNTLPESVVLPQAVVLIDGANLFYAAASLGIEIDYAKLLDYLRQQKQVVKSLFYTGIDPKNVKQQAFLHWMERNGYQVITKDLTQHSEGLKRANMNVEMAIDMLRSAPEGPIQVLLSGDGHLAYAVQAVKSLGVQVHIVALSSMVSDRLLQLADRFIDLQEIQHQIRKAPPS